MKLQLLKKNISADMNYCFNNFKRQLSTFDTSRHSSQYLTARSPLNLVAIPENLGRAINRILKGYDRELLKKDVERIKTAFKSSSFTEERDSNKLTEDIKKDQVRLIVEYGEREAMAYVASQMPFAYAPIYRIFNEIKQRIPDYHPSTLLDFGTGPGTAIWAANETFETIEKFLGIDISEPMLLLGERMMHDHLPKVEFRRFLSFTADVIFQF